MKTTIMGKNPFVNGKNHSSYYYLNGILPNPMKRSIKIPPDKILIKNILRLMQEKGHKYYKHVSVAAGLGETYVTDLIAGRVESPTMGKLKKLAAFLEVSITELTGSEHINGYVVAGGIVILTKKAKDTEKADFQLEAGLYEFEDNSNAPMAYQGWKYEIGKITKQPSEFTYRPYFVKLKNGKILVRRILKGASEGLYILINPANTEMMENIEIEYCAPVIDIIPA